MELKPRNTPSFMDDYHMLIQEQHYTGIALDNLRAGRTDADIEALMLYWNARRYRCNFEGTLLTARTPHLNRRGGGWRRMSNF
jgi:hypothetical protein